MDFVRDIFFELRTRVEAGLTRLNLARHDLVRRYLTRMHEMVFGRNVVEVETCVTPLPKRLSLSAQWEKVETHVQSDLDRTQSVLQMQDTATLHLDAAHYALDRIAIELIDVMPSIVTVATVQPPRIYAVPCAAANTDQHAEHAAAA